MDGRPGLEPLGDVGIDIRAVGDVGVVYALPGQRSRGLVAVAGTEVCIAEEQEQALEVLNAALHQVREDGLNLCHRNGAGGYQVLVPLLVARARDEGNAFAPAMTDQRVEAVRHRPLAAQQPQDHDSGVGSKIQNATGRILGISGQGGRVDGRDLRNSLRQAGQCPVGREDIRIGGGDEQD